MGRHCQLSCDPMPDQSRHYPKSIASYREKRGDRLRAADRLAHRGCRHQRSCSWTSMPYKKLALAGYDNGKCPRHRT